MRNSRLLVLLAVAAWAAGCGSPPNGSLPSANTVLSVQRALPPGTEHLYVSDIPSRSVLRFPLKAGIPQPAPDARITGFSNPRGVAVGPDGRLYVIDQGKTQLDVFNPQPGSTATPIATLQLNHPVGINTIAVDPAGYIYAGWEDVCTTEGFYCGYADVYSPYSQGMKLVNTLQFGGGGGDAHTAQVRGLAVNPFQNLAEDLDVGPPAVWTHAPFPKLTYYMYCGGYNDSGVAWGPGGILSVTDMGSSNPPDPSQIVVFPKFGVGCPPFYTITSSTLPLKVPQAIAQHGGLLYVTSQYQQSVGSAQIFVFDPTVQGSQKPLTIVAGPASGLRDPRGVAIGP